jgi:mono/diheme cytochrome c family protein
MKTLLAVFAGTVFFASAPDAAERLSGSAKLFGDAERGRTVVEMWCINCHKPGEILSDQIPSLPELARIRSKTESAVRGFLMQPHKPMPPLEISNQQIEDIVAYLATVPVNGK